MKICIAIICSIQFVPLQPVSRFVPIDHLMADGHCAGRTPHLAPDVHVIELYRIRFPYHNGRLNRHESPPEADRVDGRVFKGNVVVHVLPSAKVDHWAAFVVPLYPGDLTATAVPLDLVRAPQAVVIDLHLRDQPAALCRVPCDGSGQHHRPARFDDVRRGDLEGVVPDPIGIDGRVLSGDQTVEILHLHLQRRDIGRDLKALVRLRIDPVPLDVASDGVAEHFPLQAQSGPHHQRAQNAGRDHLRWRRLHDSRCKHLLPSAPSCFCFVADLNGAPNVSMCNSVA
mmetsp:Transcript_149565/g.261396  ORF Transcript_149565/g.261396 Transcript_149565/m.261396 type:complete len:285 (-) Transcript_149565:1623-2477(-)